MSEKKSWDVQRKPRVLPAPVALAPPPARPRIAMPNVRAVRTQKVEEPEPLSKVESERPKRLPAQSLKIRRKTARRRTTIVLAIFLAACIAGAFYFLWSPSARVS